MCNLSDTSSSSVTPESASESTASSSEFIAPTPPTITTTSSFSASTQTSTSSSSSSTSPYLSFPPLKPLPAPHGIHTATLRLASHHPAPLTLYTSFALHSAHSLGIPTSGAASLPTTSSLFTVPKSPFVHKKSQENFVRKEHRRVIKVYDANRASVDLWLRYLRRHAVGGVGMRAEVFEWVGVGEVRGEVEGLEREIGARGQRGEEEIERLAKGLVEDLEAQVKEKVEEETKAEIA